MITINSSPKGIDFALNHPAFKITSNSSPVKLVGRIFIRESWSAGSYTQLPDIYLDPDSNGSAIFPIGKILREYFETIEIAIFSITSIMRDEYSLKNYYVRFYEWDGSTLSNLQTSNTLRLLFGKLFYQDWPGHDFRTNQLETDLEYLSNIGDKIRTWTTAKHYLYWFNHLSGTNNIELRVKLYYTDKTTEDQTIDTYSNGVEYEVLIVPAGYMQLNLATFGSGKTIYRYDFGLYKSDDTQVAKTISFYIENKPWWGKQFLFRNNYGVLEAVNAAGKEDDEQKVDIETSRKRLQYDYAATDFEYIQKVKSRTKEFNCNIGPLTKTEAQHLGEILNDKLFKIGDTKLIPCNILSKSIKPYNEGEDLQVIELNYQYAFEV